MIIISHASSLSSDGNEEVCAGECRIRNLREDGLRDSGLWSPRVQQPPQATGMEMSGVTAITLTSTVLLVDAQET